MDHLIHRTVILLLAFTLTSACATDPDPSRGGFIDGVRGLLSGKYEQRKQEKQARLKDIENNKTDEDKKNITLQQRQQELEKIRISYTEKLNSFESELHDLENLLTSLKVKNERELEQKLKLENELESLKNKLKHDKKFSSKYNEDQMEKELEALIKEKNRLEQQILKLLEA